VGNPQNEEKFADRQKLFEEKQKVLADMLDEYGKLFKRGY